MSGVPLAERLVFVNNLETPSQQLALDTVNTAKEKEIISRLIFHRTKTFLLPHQL